VLLGIKEKLKGNDAAATNDNEEKRG